MWIDKRWNYPTYFAIWWCVIETALIETIVVFHDLRGVELLEKCHEGSPVPVVCHTPTVVTLPGQVAQSNILDIL